MPTTQAEADRLVEIEKIIGENITWDEKGDRSKRYSFDVTVACPEPDRPMRLTGNVCRKNWSFVLLTQSSEPIRKLTVHAGGHRNPDGTIAGGQHKHTWNEKTEDRVTYVPADIDFTDFNRALVGFLNECHIKATGKIDELRIQSRLES